MQATTRIAANPSVQQQAQMMTAALQMPETEIADSIVHNDTWTISFIDLLTLLLTLFVLLLVYKNDGDEQQQSAAITPETSVEAIVPQAAAEPELIEVIVPPSENLPEPAPNQPDVAAIMDKLSAANDEQGAWRKDIHISATANQINLEISEAILFAPASADLTERGDEVLMQLAATLSELPYQVSVEGHTDNIPIRSAQFPSNWELSSARATHVTRKLIEFGYPADTIRSIGYGDTKPLAENHTPEGRGKNRRVAIVMDVPGTDLN